LKLTKPSIDLATFPEGQIKIDDISQSQRNNKKQQGT